ncbi:MAG: hypothetical protein ACJ79D_10475 [Myxococcales bacterium]
MARISMMLVGVVAVATGIALAFTMPREKTEPPQAPAAPVQKADLTPPPAPPQPKVVEEGAVPPTGGGRRPQHTADKPQDRVDPAIEAADLQDGEGS